MHRAFTLLNLHCRDAASLISQATERQLTRLERAGLSIHLTGCSTCRRYRRQVRLLERLITSQSLDVESHLPESAKARIRSELIRHTTHID